jgi:hypothetical protein
VADESVAHNLERMDELDFAGWNGADWEGVFTRYHTDDVLVDVHGQAPTHGIREHIQAMKDFVESTGGAPVQVKSHPIRFGSGDWTCVVGELEDGSRMVTVAKWRDGAIAGVHLDLVVLTRACCAQLHLQRQLARGPVASEPKVRWGVTGLDARVDPFRFPA